jgi:hypothetical protein
VKNHRHTCNFIGIVILLGGDIQYGNAGKSFEFMVGEALNHSV